MAYFAYRGRNGAGQLVEGTLEAADPGAVATQLSGLGVTPVDIRAATAGAVAARAASDLPKDAFGRPLKVRPAELMLFSRQMYALLKAGVPIMRALGGLQESSENPAMKAALKAVRESLEGGRDLSQSMARQKHVFTPFYVAMIYVGESTGRLDEVFLRLFHHLEFQEFMRSQVKQAVRYPIFVIVAMAAAIVVINLFVIPAFAKVYRGFGAELPVITRGLIAFSDFTVQAWPWIAGGLVAAIVGFVQWTGTVGGRLAWDRIKLRLPVAGKILLKATIARFSRSFALAVRSGVPIVQGLTLTAQTVDNAFVARKVEKMREGVERGESVLRTAVAAAIFTPVALQMIVVGEESGALDDMLQEVADLYQREVEYELKTLSAQIEPILIVALGVLVLILALGVFLPIWDLGSAAMKK
ncbi:MAG: type II secretion system F family protein [Burkholderiales bacterium]|jgi:MSHA biogenesis protein MshG|nr:type II secretion system F family protein [Burkholderiales bacterium]